MNFGLNIKAFLKKEREKRSQKKIDALINLIQSKFIDEYLLNWKDTLGQEFADVIAVFDEQDWLYFENNFEKFPSDDIADFVRHLFEEPIFHTLENIFAKKMICLAFINCSEEDSSSLSDEVMVRLGISVDLELSLLEKVLKRFEELRLHNTTVKPEDKMNYLKWNICYLNEKIENTKLHNQLQQLLEGSTK